MNPYDQLCIKSDVCDMAVCDGVNVCKHAAQNTMEICHTAPNKASAPGCKRCGGRVTHGGYCASCHESYYP